MNEKSDDNGEEIDTLRPVAIEGNLPLKAVGIENLKEGNPKHMPPHRYLHRWFARRPTPAARLAILASILPQTVSSDKLLKWMQIGPKELDTDIAQYVENKKATENSRNGTLGEHYGYPRPFTCSPKSDEIEELHKLLREHWDGELPTVIDPTAGGGVIPYESIRYGLPTKANELNPVPSVILKVLLEHAPVVRSIEEDVKYWSKKINDRAGESLDEYFPSSQNGRQPDTYVTTYTVTCPSCGCDIPLVPKWWIRTRKSADKVVVRASIENDGSVSYSCIIDPNESELEGFDPNTGPVSRGGDATCLNCDIVTEDDDVKEQIIDGDFKYSPYCVRYVTPDEKYGFRSPTKKDQKALNKAKNRIESDYELSTLLTTEIPKGKKTNEPRNYGIDEWRDLFSPRQLISHYEYLDALKSYEDQIKRKHEKPTAEAIISIITLASSKVLDYNSRLSSWHHGKGYPNPLFKGNNYGFKRVFADSNISFSGMSSFSGALEKVLDSYEELVSYLPEESKPGEVTNVDAADLPYSENSIQAVIIDPPYYSSIMYAELSDIFYVWMKMYLEDTFPDLFESELTDKENEAVANSSRFDSIAGDDTSKRQLAKESYENKMSSIFSRLYDVLEPGGVMTVMFTHKETDAWDTLTMSLINSGLVITSTHPITSEMPKRVGMRDSASADSTLLLTGRKPLKERDIQDTVPTLWSDVKTDTRTAAKNAARDLIESGISLTKTDVIISAFGPTLRVFADAFPVVDDEDNDVKPRRALEEAREAVTQVLVDEYLDVEGVDDLDDVTEWYVLSWLVHESDTFSYDEGHQLGLGIGVNIDDIKRSTKTWRKSRGDISLRGQADRVQNVNEKPENRSSHTPINPDDLSFGLALDKVHAAMHIYDVQGESACCDWLRERNFDSDSTFKATLKALLQVLPHDHKDWELARNLAVGRTRDVLDLDFSPNFFVDDSDNTSQSELTDH